MGLNHVDVEKTHSHSSDGQQNRKDSDVAKTYTTYNPCVSGCGLENGISLQTTFRLVWFFISRLGFLLPDTLADWLAGWSPDIEKRYATVFLFSVVDFHRE